jgi:hypothetical protein
VKSTFRHCCLTKFYAEFEKKKRYKLVMNMEGVPVRLLGTRLTNAISCFKSGPQAQAVLTGTFLETQILLGIYRAYL